MRIAQSLTTLSLVALIAGGLVYTMDTDAEATGPTLQQAPAPRVRTATVEAAQPSERHTYFAQVEPASRFMMASTQGGRVLTRPVDIGDSVVEGDVIATLDSAPWRNALAAAQANRRSLATQRAQLERDAERSRRLIAAELGTDSTLESIESAIASTGAQLAGIDAQIDESRRQLRESTVRATGSGVVTDVFAEAGEVVSAGSPLVALSTEESVELHFDVPESAIARLQLGDTVQVSFPLANIEPRPATITHISRAGSATGRLFPVRASLADDEGVVPSMSAEIVASLAAPPGFSVPLRALVGPAGTGVSVWVVRNGQAHAAPVEPMRVDGEHVVVQSDALNVGDDVVIAGLRRLSDGALVELADASLVAGADHE
jgi:RND family efflux transporter MFP subunit